MEVWLKVEGTEFGLDALCESAASSGGARRKLLLVGGCFLLLI